MCTKPLMVIQPQVAEILFGRSVYVKKIIEEANTVEEITKLLKVSLATKTIVIGSSFEQEKTFILCLL